MLFLVMCWFLFVESKWTELFQSKTLMVFQEETFNMQHPMVKEKTLVFTTICFVVVVVSFSFVFLCFCCFCLCFWEETFILKNYILQWVLFIIYQKIHTFLNRVLNLKADCTSGYSRYICYGFLMCTEHVTFKSYLSVKN